MTPSASSPAAASDALPKAEVVHSKAKTSEISVLLSSSPWPSTSDIVADGSNPSADVHKSLHVGPVFLQSNQTV